MTQEDAKAFGIEIPKSPEVKDEFEVWDCNWETVLVFIKMQTQWQVSMSGYVGLKYEVLLMAGGLFDLYNIEDRFDVLEGLQLMEVAALKELNKESK
tara:strand:- start:163 stop:453 length:291 start_codon:yes stop_codon:yes gene_type:complete